MREGVCGVGMGMGNEDEDRCCGLRVAGELDCAGRNTPKPMHLEIRRDDLRVNENDIDSLPKHQNQTATALRSERRELAMWALVTHQVNIEAHRSNGRYELIVGDLVLIGDKTIDGQRGRKGTTPSVRTARAGMKFAGLSGQRAVPLTDPSHGGVEGTRLYVKEEATHI